MELVAEFVKTLDMPGEEPIEVRQRQKWVPPELDWVKINTDGALDCRAGTAGAGMVARNHLGMVLAGCCRRYGMIQDPLTIELLACRDALELTKQRGVNRLILETDCQTIVSI